MPPVHELETSKHAFPVCFVEREEITVSHHLKMFIRPKSVSPGFGICDVGNIAQKLVLACGIYEDWMVLYRTLCSLI
jgi:hypothetical protein